MPIKLTERTLYSPLSEYLEKEMNAKAVSEVGVKRDYLDIFFKLNTSSFVAEIKLGKEEKTFTKAIAQVVDYAFDYGTKNIIVLVFPQIRSGQVITDIEKFKQELISQKVRGWIHTDYLDTWVEDKEFKEVIRQLKEAFESKKRIIDFNSIVKAIREIIQDLFEVIRQAKTGEIFEEVAEKLELFVGLGEIKNKKQAEFQVSMLSSYLLFNQLLFYHIYKVKTNDPRLPELKPVKSFNEIQEYFQKITTIDYQPIYNIHLIEKIPENNETLTLINDAIKNLIVLRAEYITQDLAGRFFHALLPKEVAKTWAAFYTNPIAAEILANLSVDKWDETVIDPACGSGTLLSAAYRRKLELYKEQTGKELNEETLKKLHKKFIEEDITGIDIMPFAAHLSTINLSLQKLEQPTEKVRIARADSLELAPNFLFPEFKEKGILLRPFGETIQLVLFGKGKLLRQKIEPLSPTGKGEEFYLKPVDIVIMNPPFSHREKLPKDYREKLSDKTNFGKILGKICGHQINLWGYFIALADLMLKPNGKIAAVIPINIARGEATEKIRNHLLENYHIKYIVKATKDLAFSESAAFRDILLIAEKRRPSKDDLTTIIFLKKSIRETKDYHVKSIIQLDEKFVESRSIKYSELEKYKHNFMPLLMSYDLLYLFKFFTKSEKLTDFDITQIDTGFPFRPKGVAEGVFITRSLDESRVKLAKTFVFREEKDYILVGIKDISKFHYKLKKNSLQPALRTITGIKKLAISEGEADYILVDENKDYWKLLKKHGLEIPLPFPYKEHIKQNIIPNGTYLVIPDKINLVSPNTFFVSIFAEKPLYSVGSTLWYIKNISQEEAKIMNLYFNSIVSLVQIISLKAETLGTYSRLLKQDWAQFRILNITMLTEKEKENLLNLFEKLKEIEFPSLLDQFDKRFWARIELDKIILKILGFSDKEIENWLPKAYNAITNELKTLKEIK